MTNLIVILTLVTNWTGYKFEDKELGYIATNHVMSVEYQGDKKDFSFKTIPSNIAVWRTNETIWVTNNLHWEIYTNWPTVTNYPFYNLQGNSKYP